MNFLEKRISVGGDKQTLRDYLEVIQGLLKKNQGMLAHGRYIETIRAASPDIADLILVLDHDQLLSHESLQKMLSTLDQTEGYIVKTSHPELVSQKLGEVYKMDEQTDLGVQVSKGGNIYKRFATRDIDKILG